MTNSKSGLEILGVVEYVSKTRVWIRYSYGGESFRLEMPRTRANRNLKLQDRVEFALLRLLEEKK